MASNNTQVFVIGIAGGTGSGKTRLANQLKQVFGDDVVSISQDSYYKDLPHLTTLQRSMTNFDHPQSLDFDLLKEDLLKLKQYQPVAVPSYDFATHSRSKNAALVQPKHIVIVEGILVFAEECVRDLFDIKIFVDVDDDIRLLRRIERDINERGRDFASIRDQYLATVKPMHDKFVVPSKHYAQLIIPGNMDNVMALDILVTKIKQELAVLS